MKPAARPPRKPAPRAGRQHAADHAGRDAGTIGNGIGDKTGQRRDHQGEGRFGADLEQGPAKGSLVAVVEGVDAAQGEGDGDQQAAGDDEGDHVGHAGHQMFVDAGALGGARRLLGGDFGRRGWREAGGAPPPWRTASGEGVGDQRLAVADRALGAGRHRRILPPKRDMSTLVSAAMMTRSAAAISCRGQGVLGADRALASRRGPRGRAPCRPARCLRPP